MPIGISIHVGLNSVDAVAYGGWHDSHLTGPENDARSLRDIAVAQGFQATVLLTAAATSAALFGALNAAAGALGAGDFFFLSYSGHGGLLPDPSTSPGGEDETWLLYDREVTDDELSAAWAAFAAGVRVFVVSDSCHSGTVVELDGAGGRPRVRRVKGAPREVQERYYRDHRDELRQIAEKVAEAPQQTYASILSLSACKDDQLADDGAVNSRFTAELLNVWQGGQFHDYPSFCQDIVARMPPFETPQLNSVVPSPAFLAQHPLTI